MQTEDTSHRTPDRHFSTSCKLDVAKKIREDGISLCLWQRSSARASLASYFEAVPLDAWEPIDFEIVRDDYAVFSEVAEILPRVPGTNQHLDFARDLEELSRLYLSMVDNETILAKLSIIEDDRCRLFHQDNLGLRMITTYCGPGTEWLAENDIERSQLCMGSNEKIMKPGAEIRQLEAFDVGFLKGKKFGGEPSLGCVHRSPKISGTGVGYRVVFAMDDFEPRSESRMKT